MSRPVWIRPRLRAPCHGLDVQVLHGDENILLGEPCRGLLNPVVPTSDDAALQGVELIQGLLTPLGGEFGGFATPRLVGPVLAGHSALEVFQPLQLGPGGPSGAADTSTVSTRPSTASACP